MGIDPDEIMGDPDKIAKLSQVEQERIATAKNLVEQETMHTVDLAYYYLTNDAFAAVLPELEIAHFAKMQRLDLRGNSIDDDGLLDLCDCLVSAHNTRLSELDISETKVGDRGIKGLIEVMQVIFTITKVEIEGLREVSQEMRGRLEAAMRRNVQQTEEWKKDERLKDMMAAANKRDHYDEIGLNYVGKPY